MDSHNPEGILNIKDDYLPGLMLLVCVLYRFYKHILMDYIRNDKDTDES